MESSSKANRDRKEIILYLLGSVEQHLINLKAAVLQRRGYYVAFKYKFCLEGYYSAAEYFLWKAAVILGIIAAMT